MLEGPVAVAQSLAVLRHAAQPPIAVIDVAANGVLEPCLWIL
jgi:hypothetical protein